MTTRNTFDNIHPVSCGLRTASLSHGVNRLTGKTSASSASSAQSVVNSQSGCAFDTTCPVRETGWSGSISRRDHLGRSTRAAMSAFSHGVNNRTGTKAGGDQTGANQRQASYTNNLLHPVSVSIRGGNFPSHVAYVNNVPVSFATQGPFVGLWTCSAKPPFEIL